MGVDKNSRKYGCGQMWISPILQGVIREQLVGVKRTIGGRIREQLVGEQENN